MNPASAGADAAPGTRRGPRAAPARSESGQATAFIVVMTAAFLLCLGLVFDGGGVLRADTRAHLLAQEAARAGVQHIDWQDYRSGAQQVSLDPIAAGAAARAFLADSGTTGTVSVEGDTVTVTEDTPVADLFAPSSESNLPLQVTNSDGKLVGVIPRLSLLSALGTIGENETNNDVSTTGTDQGVEA